MRVSPGMKHSCSAPQSALVKHSDNFRVPSERGQSHAIAHNSATGRAPMSDARFQGSRISLSREQTFGLYARTHTALTVLAPSAAIIGEWESVGAEK